MKVITVSLLAALAMASSAEAEGMISDNTTTNANYDRDDPGHHYYGASRPASPSQPTLPKIQMAVDEFDPRDTLFGE